MIRPTLAVFAIVAIAAMMGASSVAPAYAAKPIVNTNDKVGPIEFPFPASVEICGVTNLTFLTTLITNFKEWANGKIKMHLVTQTSFVDQDGNVVAAGTAVANEISKSDNTHPKITQDNTSFSCTNGESDPENEFNFHNGMTVTFDKDGSIKHVANHGS